MKIINIITAERKSLSFEVFPPKTNDSFESVITAIRKIAALKPSYMSVTYGAGGGTSKFTVDIAHEIDTLGVTPIAHLTCVSSNKEQIDRQLLSMLENGILNVLALRGDIPSDFDKSKMEFSYASELINEIKSVGDFCIGGACYPEGHPESTSLDDDIKNLKLKVDSGCEFLTTQMFFENSKFYEFLSKIRTAGINVPVVAGIMPVTSVKQIDRIFTLSGSQLPDELKSIADRCGSSPADMKKAGIEFATKQINDLYENGINAVHVYTMNNHDVAEQIHTNLEGILK